MAYRFTKDELLADGIRRIAEERLETALKRLKNKREQLEAVHQVRKDIKKLRAVLRLVREDVGNKVYQRDIATLRDAAQRLTGARDARVKLETLDGLIEHFRTQLSPRPFPKIHQRLENHLKTESKHFLEKESAESIALIFDKLFGRVVDWQPAGKDWEAIAPGIQRSYRGGRDGFLTVQKNPSAENFHEWRKRAKDLWYHLRLICPAWPEILGALSDELKELGNFLGDHHDLAVLRATIISECTTNTQDEVEALTGLIDLRERELESASLALGARVYMEKPAEFCRRLGKYWQVWHCEDAEKKFLQALA